RKVTFEDQTKRTIQQMEEFRLILQNNNADPELIQKLNEFQGKYASNANGDITSQQENNEGNMAATTESIIDGVLENEGGYQNDENDSGNFNNRKNLGTNYRITPATLASYRKVDPKSITVDDMKNLTHDDAKNIYKAVYIENPGLDKPPDNIRANVIDMGVNAHPTTAIKLLQKAAGVPETGKLDEATINAAKKITNAEYSKVRNQRYEEIAKNNPKKKKFLNGWLKRSNSFIDSTTTEA